MNNLYVYADFDWLEELELVGELVLMLKPICENYSAESHSTFA